MRYHNITKDDMLNGDGLRGICLFFEHTDLFFCICGFPAPASACHYVKHFSLLSHLHTGIPVLRLPESDSLL